MLVVDSHLKSGVHWLDQLYWIDLMRPCEFTCAYIYIYIHMHMCLHVVYLVYIHIHIICLLYMFAYALYGIPVATYKRPWYEGCVPLKSVSRC